MDQSDDKMCDVQISFAIKDLEKDSYEGNFPCLLNTSNVDFQLGGGVSGAISRMDKGI